MQEEGHNAAALTGWRFGGFELYPAERRLLRDGVPVDVEERAFDLLVLLARQHHREIDRREITASLWGARPVSDNTLRQLLYKARRAVDDDGERQAVIRTLHGRSLQWVASLEEIETPLPASVAVAPASPVPALRLRPWWIAAAAVLVVAVVAALSVRNAFAPVQAKPLRLAIEPIVNQSGDTSMDWTVNGLPGLLASLLGQVGGIDVVDPLQSARAWGYQPQQGRSHEQQLRYVTGADTLVGGRLRKLAGDMYELDVRVARDDGTPTEFTLTGQKPSVLAVDAVSRIRRALRLDKHATPGASPHDAFLAEAYARGMDLAAQGKWNDAREYYRLCARGAPNFLPAVLNEGLSQTMADDLDGGERVLQQLAGAAQKQKKPRIAGGALMWLAHLAINRHQSADTLKYVNEALPFSRQAGDVESEIKLHAMAAIAAMGEQPADVAQRELLAAQELSESHPNLLIAKGVVLDAEARLAGARGDIAGKTAIIRKGLALREQLGDERDVVVSLNNLADALRLQHRFVEALEVGARANKRARANQYAELEFDTGFNLLDALVFMGLDEQAIAGGGPVLELARQFGFSDLWQMRTMQTTGFAQMDKGDAAAALSTLRAADAKVPLQNLSFALAVIGQSYEAYAAFAAAPTEVAGIEARLDALFKPRQGSSDYRAWAFEMPMVRALSLAAADKPREAEKALQSALLQAHDANADPAPIRTAAMLISATNNDAAIAAIGLGNFDAATETDALRLRLIAEWASRNGDAKTAAAATASAAATARLTALRKQGEAALVAAGLDPDDPLGGPSVAHATDVVRSAN